MSIYAGSHSLKFQHLVQPGSLRSPTDECDKRFIGTDYIAVPIREPECRKLLQWEHERNNQAAPFVRR